MILLNLPLELFERVLGFLVMEIGPLYVAEYRLVCKLFAIEIQKEILTRHPLVAYSDDARKLPGPGEVHMAIAIDNARFEKLFAQHGGTIIGHEVLRKQRDPLPVIQHLKDLTEAVLEYEDVVTDQLRKQCTMDISTAMSSVYWKQLRWRIFLRGDSEMRPPLIQDDLPAALAATGKLQDLLDLASTDTYRLLKSCSCLASPLEAAAACGQVEVVQEILNQIMQEVTAGATRSLMATHYLETALSIAMRKNQKRSGDLLLDLLCAEPELACRMHHFALFKECMRYVDSGLVRRILALMPNRRGTPGNEYEDKEEGNSYTLTSSEIGYLLKDSSCSVLRTLLQDGLLDPNHIDDTTPLTLAAQNHRCDLARVLLQHGAHIDGIPRCGEPVTALWYATKAGYVGFGINRLPVIRFLLENGADPDIHGDWRSPLRLAGTSWSDVHFILQRAKDFGNEIALHPKTWDGSEQLQCGKAYSHHYQDPSKFFRCKV